MGLLRGNYGIQEENHYGKLWRAIPGPSLTYRFRTEMACGRD